jgi:hypothetical protein
VEQLVAVELELELLLSRLLVSRLLVSLLVAEEVEEAEKRRREGLKVPPIEDEDKDDDEE